MFDAFRRNDTALTRKKPGVSDTGVIESIVSPQILELLDGIGLQYPQCKFGDAEFLTDDATKVRTVILRSPNGMRLRIKHDGSQPFSDDKKLVIISSEGSEPAIGMTVLAGNKDHLIYFEEAILNYAADPRPKTEAAVPTLKDDNVSWLKSRSYPIRLAL